MSPLTPLARGRIAFVAFAAALYLVIVDRMIATSQEDLTLLIVPALSVVATGQVDAKEAFLRAALAAAILVLSVFVVCLAQGRGLPDFQIIQPAISIASGLFALNLVIVVATSAILRRIWPNSDLWTH